MVISLGWLSPATPRGLPADPATGAGSGCLLGLAPTGGYRATPVARRAVGSYPTFSPLPLDKGRFVFCGPVPSPRGAQELPGSLPYGARTFLSMPLKPAYRDHHALPPPAPKLRDSEGSRQGSPGQAADEAGAAARPESAAPPTPPPPRPPA